MVIIVYLRTYRLHTPDIGPLPKSLSAEPVEVEVDGSSWYQVEDILLILDHRDSPGPMCECLVRWKDFDSVMTLGSVVTALLLLLFKLMTGF
jgi:hypothetical protein